MKLITRLNETEQNTLEYMRDNHKRKITRKRAHSILLNQEGYSFRKIGDILDVCSISVSNWVKTWEMDGIAGLIEKKLRFRAKKLNEREESDRVSKRTSEKLKNSACRNHRKNGHKNLA